MNNNSYYQNPIFPGLDMSENMTQNNKVSDNYLKPYNNYDVNLENILRLNKGKKVKLFVTIPGSNEWQDKSFEGIIEEANKDYIIISDPSDGKWHLILLIYLDYITFEEPITNTFNIS